MPLKRKPSSPSLVHLIIDQLKTKFQLFLNIGGKVWRAGCLEVEGHFRRPTTNPDPGSGQGHVFRGQPGRDLHQGGTVLQVLIIVKLLISSSDCYARKQGLQVIFEQMVARYLKIILKILFMFYKVC